jgi:hypothetical protein
MSLEQCRHTLPQHGDLLRGVRLGTYTDLRLVSVSKVRSVFFTNGADDAGPTMVLLWLVIDVEVALPFQLRLVGEVVESVPHICGVVDTALFLLRSMDKEEEQEEVNQSFAKSKLPALHGEFFRQEGGGRPPKGAKLERRVAHQSIESIDGQIFEASEQDLPEKQQEDLQERTRSTGVVEVMLLFRR